MELVVHGTKRGYKLLFTTANAPNLIAGDVRSASGRGITIGQEAYSISFSKEGIYFSKYKILRDLQRNLATGNICFTLFLLRNEKLPGQKIKELLDNFISIYQKKYAPDNNLDSNNENWNEFEELVKKESINCKQLSWDDQQFFESGDADEAFIYFKNGEIEKYFDDPFHKEYTQYKQILFINNNLFDQPSNPLHALRHSNNDLTGHIDIDKKVYRLKNFEPKGKDGIFITLNCNGKQCKNGDRISNRDIIAIGYIKKYHRNIPIVEGKTNNEEIKRYLLIDDENRTIQIKNDINLNPDERNISIKVNDFNDQIIQGIEINCEELKSGEKKDINSQRLIFKGDEIGLKWKLQIKGTNKYQPFEDLFTPDSTPDIFHITLKEVKTVVIKAFYQGNEENIPISEFMVSIADKGIRNQRKDSIDFFDSEINKEWLIEIEKNEKGYRYFGSERIIPREREKVNITLGKQQVNSKRYAIEAGEHGKLIKDCPGYSTWENGEDVKIYIRPHKGYKFNGFILDNTKRKEDFEGILTAQYKRSEKPIIKFFLLSVSIILLGISLITIYQWGDMPNKTNDSKQPQENEIRKYLEDIYLHPNTLKDYQNVVTTQMKNHYSPPWPLSWFIICKDFILESETTFGDTYSKQLSSSIENAINIRKGIIEGEVQQFKEFNYSEIQFEFKKVISNINKNQFDTLQNTLLKIKGLDTMNLLTVAFKIDSINKNIQMTIAKPGHEESVESSNSMGSQGQKDNTNKGNDKSASVDATTNSQGAEKIIPENRGVNSEETEIIKYIKSDNFTRDKLIGYKNSPNINSLLKESIQLCLELWEIDGIRKTEYNNLLTKVKDDDYLKKSKLKLLLEYLISQDNPRILSEIPNRNRINPFMELKRPS